MRSRRFALVFFISLAFVACSADADRDPAAGTGNGWEVGEQDTGQDDAYSSDVHDSRTDTTLYPYDVSYPDDVSPADVTDEPDINLLCPPPEPDRYYEAAPDQCPLIDFGCEEGWAHFSDVCGCGCERVEPHPDPGPMCRPMQAGGEGMCDAILGAIFDGTACHEIGGCDCVGDDCHRLYDSVETCEKATGDCARHCGNPDGVICDIYPSIDPADCADGAVYTVMDCEPLCVDPQTCERN